MPRFLLIIGALVLGALLAGGLWIWWAVPRSMVTGQASSRELLGGMELDCPAKTVPAARPWGKAGWMVYCESDGELHGPWLAAEAGRLAIRGEYSNGERTGRWRWYDNEGNVAKQVRYEAGMASYTRERPQ